MYEERKEKFSVKDVLIQLLFVVLFVFILIWLFPTKGYVNKKIEPLYGNVFNTNLTNMKEAAKSYFTTPRLPKNVGDKVSKTLKEMYDLNLILPFKDSNGKQCDANKSYVEITKMDEEFIMKVNLSCSDNDAYIITHMGCYDYCPTGICEEKKPETPVATNPGVKPTPKPTPNPTPEVNKEYEYKLVINGKWGNWGNWSDWSTNKVTSADYVEVQTENRNIFSHYEQAWGIVGYDRVEKVTYVSTPYTVQEYQKVEVGTTKKEVGKKPVYANYITSNTPYTYWSNASRGEYTSAKTSTSTKKYTFVSSHKELDCTNSCKTVTHYVYDVKTLLTGTTTKKTCPSGYSDISGRCTKYDIVYEIVKVYENRLVTVTKYENRPVYTYVNEPKYGWVNGDAVYKTITYYRSRSRQFIDGNVTYKWSKSNNDKSLLDQGYTLTGKVR